VFWGEAVRSVNGFKMRLDLRRDSGISKDLFLFGKREVLSTDLIQDSGVLKEGDTVLDIGANIGYYALLESRLIGDLGYVFAIEPVSTNYEMLCSNIELNNIHNIKTFRLAAGAEDGEAEIHVAQKGNISSFIYRDDVDFVRTEHVQIRTVDSFLQEHGITPALIRMDVEGFEVEIIKGMHETLKQKPKLLIEVHAHLLDKETLNSMFTTLDLAGYREAVVIKERNELWMRRDTSVRPALRWLSNKIKDRNILGIGKVESMSLTALRDTLSSRHSAFHLLLS
jgi:FkbM family methyltransferase